MAPAHPAYGEFRPVTTASGIVLCDNPSEMTFEGTNTAVLRAPGSRSAVVVDPGPDDDAHCERVAELAGEVELVLITHRHVDHTEGIDRFARITGAPVRALADRFVRGGAEVLSHGDVVEAAGVRLTTLATPGHTADSLCFEVRAADGDPDAAAEAIVLGDTILGRDSTVLDSEDGDLGHYLDSLDLLAEHGEGVTGLPGHGPNVDDVAAAARALAAHRRDRLDQIRAARAELGTDADAEAITEYIYTDVSPFLRLVAQQSTMVALRYLERIGE